MIITAWNPETDGLERTNLTATVQAGGTVVKVQNTDRYSVDSLILLGEQGTEQAEIRKVLTKDSQTQLTLSSATQFAHGETEPIYKLRYDKVQFYRSSTADGSYTLLDTVDIDVDNRNLKTEYQDLTGTGSSFYKTKYYNSVSFEETEFSDYISAEGYGAKTIGSVIESVVRFVKDAGYGVLTSEDYLDLATEVNSDIESQSERPYNFMKKAVTLNRVAGQSYLDLPERYFKFYKLEYTNTVGSYPRTNMYKPIPRGRFDNSQGIVSSDYLRVVTLDEDSNRILLKPTPLTNGTGAFTLWYYEQLPEFTDMSQEVQLPNTLVYRYKFLSEFYSSKAKDDPQFNTLASKYEAKYGNELMKLQRSNRKDVGTDRSFADSARTSSATYGSSGKVYKL